MKVFTLTCGAQVLLDDEDYDRLPKSGWYLSRKEIHNPNTDYAVHDDYGKMHRWIMGFMPNEGKELVIDHINRNGLDNRKENLRIVSCSTNKKNGSIYKNSTFNFNGVRLEVSKEGWCRFRAQWNEGEPRVCKDGKRRGKMRTKSFSFKPDNFEQAKKQFIAAVLFRIQKMKENKYELDERSTTIERALLSNGNPNIDELFEIDFEGIVSSRVGASAPKKESSDKE